MGRGGQTEPGTKLQERWSEASGQVARSQLGEAVRAWQEGGSLPAPARPQAAAVVSRTLQAAGCNLQATHTYLGTAQFSFVCTAYLLVQSSYLAFTSRSVEDVMLSRPRPRLCRWSAVLRSGRGGHPPHRGPALHQGQRGARQAAARTPVLQVCWKI